MILSLHDRGLLFLFIDTLPINIKEKITRSNLNLAFTDMEKKHVLIDILPNTYITNLT